MNASKTYTLIDSQMGVYAINEKFEMVQNRFLDEGYSGQWKLVGFTHTRKKLTITPQKFLELSQSEKEYKNGKSKWHPVDNDCGTIRAWSTRVWMFTKEVKTI